MPPSFGNRDDSSITASPCGMKKKTAAISHINNDPGPNFAVVPRCLRPRTATRLKRTRSRSLSPRTRCGGLVVCVTLEAGRWEMGDGTQMRRRFRLSREASARQAEIRKELQVYLSSTVRLIHEGRRRQSNTAWTRTV